MSYSGDAAEQVVRMSLETGEVAVRLAGSGAKEIAVMLYAVLRDQQKTRGKTRLESMLRSGKELKVFAVKDSELQKFCQEAKKYGVLYCVLKDRDATDGITDIMVRAEDASKINRIFERFQLSTVDMASIRQEIERSREERAEGETPTPEGGTPENSAQEGETPPESNAQEGRNSSVSTEQEKNDFLDALFGPGQARDESQRENPTEARTASPQSQSGPTSDRQQPTAGGTTDDERARARPSVKKELEEIRRAQKETAKAPREQQIAVHQHPKKKIKRKKGRSR